jgi:hypothetical protein
VLFDLPASAHDVREEDIDCIFDNDVDGAMHGDDMSYQEELTRQQGECGLSILCSSNAQCISAT